MHASFATHFPRKPRFSKRGVLAASDPATTVGALDD